MKHFLSVVLVATLCIVSLNAQKKEKIGEPYAWRLSETLGTRYRVPIDTLHLNFFQTDQPYSWDDGATDAGYLGGPSMSRIVFNRYETPEFMFKFPFMRNIVTPQTYTFYNTRLPMTLLSYMSGAGKENRNDDLKATFSANVNKNLGFEGNAQYLYNRGYYARQRTKNFNWQLAGNYVCDKYQLDVMFNAYSLTMQENGGIKDDAFILRPDNVDNGRGNVGSKDIPVNLNGALTRLKGKNVYATHRYNIGSYKTKIINDTLSVEEYVPVMSIIHTFDFEDNQRGFSDYNADDNKNYFKNSYINDGITNDTTSYWKISNTIGVSLLEGFSKRAKMGVSAFATYEVRRFKLMPTPSPESANTPPQLPMLPEEEYPFEAQKNMLTTTDNIIWVGGELSKRQGSLLTYDVKGKWGLTGSELGSMDIEGGIQSKFKFLKDSLTIRAYGFFKNIEPNFYTKRYNSNHFVWNNDFGKIRKFRVGGEILIPGWGTYINVGFENIQNHVYFNKDNLPTQESDNIQLFTATLKQKLNVSVVHLDIEAIYQASSKQSAIPVPALSAYGNLYVLFKIAKVLETQIGVDCRYNTLYYSEIYNPATATFRVQDEYKVGNYPFMNVYANMKLKMVRFYVMYSHFNKGLFGGNNYMNMPHYPMNPASFQFGVSVDFAN
ncbi:MAG: putative porin [Bacteroidales bacterium]|nr:putative porin [Bacteroidales bacterium]